MISSVFIFIFILTVLIFAVVKKTDVISAFTEGAKNGLSSVISILFPLTLIITAVSAAKSSGLLDIVSYIFLPFTDFFGIPSEAVPIIAIRPFSGSGALAFLENIIRQCGTDSRTAELSAVICASSETLFYTVGIYLNGLTDKCGRIFLCSLIGYICSVAISCLIV